MTQRERDRLVALKKAGDGLITQQQAAEEIVQSERNVRRLRKKLKVKGLGAHGKLTTCARIELTTPKSGLATWQATESRSSIWVAGA